MCIGSVEGGVGILFLPWKCHNRNSSAFRKCEKTFQDITRVGPGFRAKGLGFLLRISTLTYGPFVRNGGVGRKIDASVFSEAM